MLDVRGRHVGPTAGILVCLTVAALAAVALPRTPAAAATTPAPVVGPPMPLALDPGSWTAPLFPLRSVPAYAAPGHIEARIRPADGGTDQRFAVPTPPGSTLLWGDWNSDGAVTPIVFTNGHWVMYDAIIGSRPAPVASFDYGAPGDRPVVGDWNRDTRTDIGVVRGNVWLLRDSPSPGPTWRQLAWGFVTDVPVTGDWDGDGRAGIGLHRGNTWLLRDVLKPGKPTYTFRFGTATDVPVTGDWDGDGADTPGVVRDGSTWFLQDTLVGPPAPTVTTRVVNGPTAPGTMPAPWPTPAGPTGAACATAAAGVLNRPQVGGLVVPSVILDKALPYDTANPALGADPVYQLRVALLESERYLLGAQYLERWYEKRGQRFTDVLSRFEPAQQEYAIRRPAMAALATAVSARTKAHHDLSVGQTRDAAIRYADWLVRSIACTHATVTPGGWGAGWQTAHWAMLAGQAAWLIWDYLTPQTREYVAQMLVYEADVQLTRPVEYWADATGAIVNRGDTKSEEDAWNAALLELAVMMMPKHQQAPSWRRKAVDLEVAAYARISDLNSAVVVNGLTVTDRLEGANAYDDGTVENHGVIHPDYMTNIQQSWWAADFAGLAGRLVPESAFHNGALTYGAFTTVQFQVGSPSLSNGAPYAEPGGALYRLGSNDIYYPQGSHWGTGRRAHFVSFDAHAYAYGLDTATLWAARDALASHVAGQHSLVANNGTGDGRTYSYDPTTANSQDNYNGREEYAASQLAAGWLALYVSRNAWDQTFNEPPLNRRAFAPLPPQPLPQNSFSFSAPLTPDPSTPGGERRSP